MRAAHVVVIVVELLWLRHLSCLDPDLDQKVVQSELYLEAATRSAMFRICQYWFTVHFGIRFVPFGFLVVYRAYCTI